MNIVIFKTRNHQFTSHHKKQIEAVSSDINVKFFDPSSASSKTLKEADAVICFGTDIKNLADVPRLKWMHITSAGANMLSQEVVNSEVIVTNSSGVHPIPISEHVLTFMLMLSRKIPEAFRNQIEKKEWVRDIMPDELAGKKVLIVGMGQIGERVAMLCQAFEMEVYGIVRNPKNHQANFPVAAQDKLDEWLKQADYVVNCLPATAETYHLFDKKRLHKFKKGSYYINIGRGDTTDEAALVEQLKEGGKIAGAGLDVFEEEPLSSSSPLWKMNNVIITPHYSGSNPHYADRVIEIFIQNLKAYLAKKPMPNLVDKKLGY